MTRGRIIAALMMLAPGALAGCAYYGPPAPPPPAGWAGESWPRHVRRCARRFPRYDPATDTVYRPSGPFRCPL